MGDMFLNEQVRTEYETSFLAAIVHVSMYLKGDEVGWSWHDAVILFMLLAISKCCEVCKVWELLPYSWAFVVESGAISRGQRVERQYWLLKVSITLRKWDLGWFEGKFFARKKSGAWVGLHKETKPKGFLPWLGAAFVEPKAAQRFKRKHHNDINSSTFFGFVAPWNLWQFPLYLSVDSCHHRVRASRIERIGFQHR